MIASFYDGRVRLRLDALKNPTTMSMAEKLISLRKGVRQVTANPRTGSLLILYDPAVITREDLLTAATALHEQLGLAKGAKPDKRAAFRPLTRRTEAALLCGLYAATVAAGFTNRRAHLSLGLLFTLLLGAHLYTRRSSII